MVTVSQLTGQFGPRRTGPRELGRTLDCAGCGLRRSRHRLEGGNPQVRRKIQSTITGGLSLRLAALTAGVVAPSLDELAERSLDLLAAAHRVRSGAAGRRRSTRSGTAPCGLPRAA